MPKVSRVGKFRKTTAASTSSSSLSATKNTNKSAAPQSLLTEAAAAAIAKKTDNDSAATISLSLITSKRDAASASPEQQQQQQQHSQQPQSLSRGQRKRLAKREQYMKREQMVLSSLELQRQEDQKKRIDGLDAMKAALLDTVRAQTKSSDDKKNTSSNNTSAVKTNKARQRLVNKEVTQMSLVLQHPAFQADPFATIRQHLQNSIVPAAANDGAGDDTRKAAKTRPVKKDSDRIKRKRKKRARPTRSKAR